MAQNKAVNLDDQPVEQSGNYLAVARESCEVEWLVGIMEIYWVEWKAVSLVEELAVRLAVDLEMWMAESLVIGTVVAKDFVVVARLADQ